MQVNLRDSGVRSPLVHPLQLWFTPTWTLNIGKGVWIRLTSDVSYFNDAIQHTKRYRLYSTWRSVSPYKTTIRGMFLREYEFYEGNSRICNWIRPPTINHLILFHLMLIWPCTKDVPRLMSAGRKSKSSWFTNPRLVANLTGERRPWRRAALSSGSDCSAVCWNVIGVWRLKYGENVYVVAITLPHFS